MENEKMFTIGELARMVGVSVRALQYYDRNNLLKSTFTEGGRRIYTRADVIKLQQILFLKSLGFSLEEIGSKILKQEDTADFEKVFSEQRDILIDQIAKLNKIVDTLNLIIAETKAGQEISLEKLMTILSLMKEGNPYTFVIRYFNRDQINGLINRFESDENANEFARKANSLFKRLNVLYQKHVDPESAEGQEFAKQWWIMVKDLTKGDQNMLQTLISSGYDIDNWPDEAKGVQEPIKNFLSKAIDVYLKNNHIKTEAVDHD